MLEQQFRKDNEDERLARQLQDEFNRGSTRRHVDYSQMAGDSYQPVVSYPTGYYAGNSGYTPSYSTPPSNSHQNLEIGEEEIGEFVKALKSNVLPLLAEEFKKTELPKIDESVEAGKLGNISFGLDGIKIAKAKIPEEKMDVKINVEEQELELEMTGIKLKLKEFSWYYRKKKFPKLKDSGKMNAGISDCVVKLKLGWNGSGITTKNCQVTVGTLKLKVSGTIVSLVYNIIIAAVKKMLKTQLEKYLTDMIRSTIEDGANDFLKDM